MKRILKISTCIVLSSLFFSVTYIHQVIGYGTSNIDALYDDNVTKEQLYDIVNNTINDNNKLFYIEIIVIAVFVFMLNYFLLKKLRVKKVFITSLILVTLYVVSSLISLSITSDKFKRTYIEKVVPHTLPNKN